MKIKNTSTQREKPLVDGAWSLVVTNEDVARMTDAAAWRLVKICPQFNRKAICAEGPNIIVWHIQITTSIKPQRAPDQSIGLNRAIGISSRMLSRSVGGNCSARFIQRPPGNN